MIERIYIDTSVIGGYFDVEFEKYTKPLFEKILKKQYKVIFSKITDEELLEAPIKVKALLQSLPNEIIEYVEVSEEATELANNYLKAKVVGKTSYADCLHIAIATIQKADLLISWNFKHIVNVQRIRGYNSVNLKFGYHLLEIRSPRDIYYEK
ncbi:MAG: PIN domain-containing protein [Candidatus Kapabacteria bacterium]|nr:PIN domain-containing protein [Candidatus Kapabacteria bacterium]